MAVITVVLITRPLLRKTKTKQNRRKKEKLNDFDSDKKECHKHYLLWSNYSNHAATSPPPRPYYTDWEFKDLEDWPLTDYCFILCE